MIKLPWMDALGSVGLVGERKALALLCLGFYATLFFMIGLSAGSELPEWVPVFVAMTLIYAIAFFSVAAEWFWGRWFAIGLGYWGMTMAVMAFVTARALPPAMVIFGAMHGLVSLCLMGEKMAGAFEAKPAWRERWKLDEQGVVRLRKSVTRAASSLPALVMFALAPREGAGMALAAGAIVLASLGLTGLLQRRTWGVMALGAAGVATLLLERFSASTQSVLEAYGYAPFDAFAGLTLTPLLGLVATLLLFGAALPFAEPMLYYLRRR